MIWDNERSLQLIELYESHRVLWCIADKNHFNKSLKENAWKNISSQMKIPMEEVKRKMTAILGSFRREKSRQKKYHKTGKDGYKSKWFAYDSLKFLSAKNIPYNSADQSTRTRTSNRETNQLDESDYTPTPNASDQETNSSNLRRSKLFNKRMSPVIDPKDSDSPEQASKPNCKRKSSEGIKVDKTFQKALKLLKNIDDSYDIFGRHVANELRKYNTETLSYVKKAISDIIFEADIGKIPKPKNEYINQRYSRQEYLYSRRCSTSTPIPSPSPAASPETLIRTPAATVPSSPSPDDTLRINDSHSL